MPMSPCPTRRILRLQHCRNRPTLSMRSSARCIARSNAFPNERYAHTQSHCYSSQCPGVRGNGVVSLTFVRPVMYIKNRSKPSPNPACFAEPYRLRSRYHFSGSAGPSVTTFCSTGRSCRMALRLSDKTLRRSSLSEPPISSPRRGQRRSKAAAVRPSSFRRA